MSAAHTPGPWDLQILESNTGRIRHLCPMDDDGLSLLTVVEHAGKKFAAVYEEGDARLIAAAPDLLSALKVLLRDMEAVDAAGQYGLELQVGMNQAHKAIAKATGEAG